MGKGIDAVRSTSPEHTAMLDDFKDQLLIVLIKRLANAKGELPIPVAEVDDTGQDMLAFRIDFETRTFHFQIEKKS